MPSKSSESLHRRNRELQARVHEAEETLRALRSGEVDAIVAAGPGGDRVYTLKGADAPYRVIVQEMADGALTLALDGLVLFANEQFAAMTEVPLEHVIGARFQDFLAPEDEHVAAALLTAGRKRRAEVRLRVGETRVVPVYLSVNTLVLDRIECFCVIVTDLTEQKKNEEIVAAEVLARSILDQTAGAILVVESAGRIIRASRAAEILARAPVLLRQFDAVFRLHDAGRSLPYSEILGRVRQLGSIAGLQAMAETPQGTTLDLLVNAALLIDSEGRMLGCTIVFSDISRIKAVEKALVESERKYRSLFENSLDAVLLTTPDGGIAAANPAACGLFSLSAEQICACGQPGLIDNPEGGIRPDLAAGMRDEFPFVRQDGSRFLGEYSSVPVHDEGRAFLIVRDITARRKAEQDLRESEERYRLLIEANPMGVASGAAVEDEGLICTANAALLTMLGYAREDIEGQTLRWADLNPAGSALLDGAALAEARARGFSAPFEKELVRKDGSRLPAMAAFAVVGADKQMAVAFFADLTEQKQAESQLRRAQKMESIGLLAGGIAHDFNNLLTAIMGNASLVAEEATGSLAESARDIVLCAERAAYLTQQLLAYSGKGEFIVKDLELSNAVREILGLVRLSIPKNVEVRLDLRERLPLISIDPGQLQQVVMNLVINAGEAIGEKAGGTISVVTDLRDFERGFVDAAGETVLPGRYVLLEVADTGSGIEAKFKSKIFDPFFSSKFAGRGLGLAAVSGVVRARKGAITVQSEPGEGSIFRVYLPAAPTGKQPAEQESAGDSRETILVADDEDAVRRAIVAVLRRRGYRVLEARDGKEALAISQRRQDICLVIVDLIMPEMGGDELVAELKKHRPNLKVLLTSGYGQADPRLSGDLHNRATFIQKPYTGQQLADAVARLMRSSAASA